ncbi:uncharacterized protein [Chironomus tepperi]|uniref:uncharacterized protein isoform X1 n=1 Tax=Chironomus tepperi TaxID=113505 RepID=UPI00391F7760
MVLSKMYCSEQIVIPEKISNLLKTYAKAALKTQPYDLLRWSAAYFRCLSMDIMPPVKLRYEQENMLGCLTKGYIKVLLNQVGKGFYVQREILDHRWNELCLPEDELLKFLSLTRMLYWPQVHWLKLMSVMVGSINQSFQETLMMLFELLTDEPEGGSSPVPLWSIRECFKYLAVMDCTEEQTYFDGRKVLAGNALEDELKMPQIPQKLSSTSFRNAVIDYWKYRIENDEKVKSRQEKDIAGASSQPSTPAIYEKDNLNSDKVCNLCSIPSTLRCGSDFRLTGEYKDPMNVIKGTNSFNDVIMVVKQLKCDDEDGEIADDYEKISKRDAKVNEMRQNAAQSLEDDAKNSLERECWRLMSDIGPPWNWLHNFTSHNCYNKSYNFIEQISITSDMTLDDDDNVESTDESLNMSEMQVTEKQLPPSATSFFDDVQSSTSGVSVTQETSTLTSSPSNEHKVLVDTICNLSEAIECGDCIIRETSSIASVLDAQHEKKQLETVDYERLKKFIDRAMENGLVFNDLNELYNYFIQESSRELYMKQRQKDVDGDAETENLILSSTSLSAGKKHKRKETEAVKNNENVTADGKNVVSIFGESGIEVDNKLLDAKVSERMILGLVDKTQSDVDNISDAASSNASISSLSNAETVKMKENINVTREKDTQTMSYQERIHESRMTSGQRKSATFIEERQPFTCKIPKLPGIGARLSDERIDKILKFITHRSFQQGGFVYPRNFLEDDCPSLIEN